MYKHLMIATACLALVGAAATTAGASELSQLCAAKAGVTPVRLDDAKIKEILSERGYTQIRGLGEEEGCVEAKGLDKDGKRFEVYLHPHTGDIVRVR
jgi:hypothetical protein